MKNFVFEDLLNSRHTFSFWNPCFKSTNSNEFSISSLMLCLVELILEGMENIGKKSGWKTMFSTIWQRVKNTEDRKPGRKFSLPSPQISSSQIGRKTMERKVLWQPNYRNALSFPMVIATQQRRRRQFSNPVLSTIHHHHRNPKITQNQHKKQLKINSNPIRKPIPNPTQNQSKTKSTQNQPIFIFFIIIIIIFSLPCNFRTVKKTKKRCRDLKDDIYVWERAPAEVLLEKKRIKEKCS